MLVMVYGTEGEAEAALTVLAGLAEVTFGPAGENLPLIDLPGGGRGILTMQTEAGAYDPRFPTSTRWAEPRQAVDGRWFFESLESHPRFTGTDWRDEYLANGGPAFDHIQAPAEWFDAEGALLPPP
jgi:hypothetical protein